MVLLMLYPVTHVTKLLSIYRAHASASDVSYVHLPSHMQPRMPLSEKL